MVHQLQGILYKPNIATTVNQWEWRGGGPCPQAHHIPHQPPPGFSSTLPWPKVFVHCSHKVTPNPIAGSHHTAFWDKYKRCLYFAFYFCLCLQIPCTVMYECPTQQHRCYTARGISLWARSGSLQFTCSLPFCPPSPRISVRWGFLVAFSLLVTVRWPHFRVYNACLSSIIQTNDCCVFDLVSGFRCSSYTYFEILCRVYWLQHHWHQVHPVQHFHKYCTFNLHYVL